MLMPGPGGPYQITFQQSPLRTMIEQVRPKNIQLPPMRKVTETLGALGTLARQFLIRSSSPERTNLDAAASDSHPAFTSSSNSHINYDLFPAASTNNFSTALTTNTYSPGSPPLKVNPEEDEQLLSALYTLGRNVLGQVRNFNILS